MVTQVRNIKGWAQEIIDGFRGTIERTLDHSKTITELVPLRVIIGWDERKGRVDKCPAPDQLFETVIFNRLGELILDYGHLLKRCEAPAKMKPGRKPKDGASAEEAPSGPCGKKFVAIKETQLYCTSACLDRALTRRAEKPKTKKKRNVARPLARRTKTLARVR